MTGTIDMVQKGIGNEILIAAEAGGELFAPQVAGYAIWPLMRYRAWQLVSGVEPFAVGNSLWQQVRRRPRDVTRVMYALWAGWQRWRAGRRRRAFVVLSLEAHRSVRRHDGWWDVYLDDIANDPALAGEVLRCELREFMISPWRSAAPRHLYTDALLCRQLWAGLRDRDPEATVAGEQLAKTFLGRLDQQDVTLDPDQRRGFATYCQQRARMFRVAFDWWSRLFADVQPRVLALTDAYDQHAPVAAARARGMPVVEFQHGVIHRDHPGYIWEADTRRYFDRLPVPTDIATYGDFWSDLLVSRGFWQPEMVHAIGSVRMDWLRRESGTAAAGGSPLNIVYTTQHPTRAHALRWLPELVGLLRRGGMDFRLTIKVHRMETPAIAEYRALERLGDHIRVLSAYEGDTLALIADADVHVSGWSTCHYEAVGLRTPTIVLRYLGPDRTADMAGLPGVRVADSVDSLFECLRAIRRFGREDESLEHAATRLFRPGAVDRAVALLEQRGGAGRGAL